MSDGYYELAQRVRSLEVEMTRRPEVLRLVYSEYTTQTAQSIPNNTSPFTTVNYDTMVEDDFGLVTVGANWIWTAPFPGRVEVCAAIMFAGTTTWAAGEAGEIDLYKNGAKLTVFDRKDNYTGAATGFMQLSMSRKARVTTGDTLAIRVFQNSGAALTLYSAAAGFNWITIELVG